MYGQFLPGTTAGHVHVYPEPSVDLLQSVVAGCEKDFVPWAYVSFRL